MMAFWLLLMFVGLTMLIYGLLTLHSIRRDSDTPAE
jgi:hypothetical protein